MDRDRQEGMTTASAAHRIDRLSGQKMVSAPESAPLFRVGTSGWSYPNWRRVFYPPGMKQGDWLAHYAASFTTVELNATFYRLPTPPTIQRWSTVTPPGFRFALKAWRAITHERRLEDCQAQLAMFFDRIAPLSAKIGPVLFQLPPRFPVDPGRLAGFLAELPAGYHHVFEFRDPSWWRDDIYRLLTDRGASFVCFDLAGLRSPRLTTSARAYVRLHGFERAYQGRYPLPVLADWAGWLGAQRAAGSEAWVYLDNTMLADDALCDARTLDSMLAADSSS